MKVNKHLLPNGLRVLTIPRPDAIAANFLVLAAAGSKYETKEINGLSHFLEHMCFKGTRRYPKSTDVSMALDALGAKYNAFTSHEYTGYYVTVQPRLYEQALEILAEMYLHPLLPAAEIEKEKGVIIEEINMYEDMPSRQVADLFMNLLYGDTPAGWNIIGTKETVRALRREDLLAYRHKSYVARATLVAAAGQFNEGRLLKQIGGHFKTISRTPPAGKTEVSEEQSQPEILVKHKQSDQTHFVIGFRTRPLEHPDHFALEVLAALLGGGMSSRLFRKIRDELGAAYYVRAYQDDYTDHGYLAAALGVDAARVPAIIKATLAEFGRLKQETVPAPELRRVKDFLIGNLYLGLETAGSLASFYGLQTLLQKKIYSPRQAAGQLEAVRPADLKRLAGELFRPAGLNLALIGPFADGAPFASLLRV